MRTFIEKTRTLPELDTVTCNCCGNTINVSNKNIEPWIIDTMIQIYHEFGYGTATDGESLKFDVCTDCLELWVETFKIPAERINNYA